MIITSLSKLLYGMCDIPHPLDLNITGLTLDSRLVQPGELFLACQGTHLDGRKFIKDAIQRGACAVLAEQKESDHTEIYFEGAIPVFLLTGLNHKLSEIAARFYGHPAKSLQIVGITGTNGKTSCSHFIAAALHQLNLPCGVIGTLGSGLYGDIKPGLLTTPDAITIQKTFAEFLAQGVTYVAMEVSSHSIDQGRINGIPFVVGIFTNLTREHLDYHGTMEAYGAVKKKLFDNPLLHHAVINCDDLFGKEIIGSISSNKSVFAYSAKNTPPSPDEKGLWIRADQVHLNISGIDAKISSPWGEGELHSGLIGEFNLSNLLAVLVTLCLLDVPLETALICLAGLNSVPGRMQTFGGKDKPLVVVDYSHTPDSLEKALTALRLHCQGKLYCVFGCGGDRDRGKRPIMAKIAEQYADFVMVTDDNPRTEDPKQIAADILQGFSMPDKAVVQHDRSKAIGDVIQYAKAGDCVLIAGKGAESYQQIGDQKIPFSDVEKVQESL